VDAQLVVFRSISRAVWRNDIRLARKLLASSPIALRHLSITGLQVQLQDANEFDADFLAAQNAYADQRERLLDERQRGNHPTAARSK
jgi:hypothetical protein